MVGWPDGHFYSPVPSQEDLEHGSAVGNPLEGLTYSLTDDRDSSITRFNEVRRFLDVSKESFGHYTTQNDQFNKADAIWLAGFLVSERPSKILEVGSGWSTSMMIDTIDAAGLDAEITSVEPFPERLLEAVPNFEKNCKLVRQKLQETEIDNLRLDGVDLLFIDSSHVVKFNSDVLFEAFSLLPKLRPGALVHVHDIFYPWEYPEHWRQEGRWWTEIYLLRALLCNSSRYEVVSWPSALAQIDPATWCKYFLPDCGPQGGSIWLRVLS